MVDPRWFIFGDSLSDDGAGQGVLTEASTLPFGGRASTGLLWHEVLRDGLMVAPDAAAISQAPELDGTLGGSIENGVSFAHSGAQTTDTAGGTSPGALEQAQGFAALVEAGDLDAPNAHDLFLLFIGGNDLVNGLRRNLSVDVDEIIDNIEDVLNELTDAGMQRLLLAGLPSIGGVFIGADSQAFSFLLPVVNTAIDAINIGLERLLDDLEADGVETHFFDTAQFVQDVEADPQAFGFENVTTDCFTEGFSQETCPDTFFSVDGLHPTAAGQAAIAEAVRDSAEDAAFDLSIPTMVPDMLFAGTPRPDDRSGGAGNDQLFGRAGNDTLTGGAGNDLVQGDIGFDSLNGNTGNDTLRGGDGQDTANGGDGDDQLFGNNGNDVLAGDAGNDTLNGGLGADTLEGGVGADRLTGLEGADLLRGGSEADTLLGNAGADTLFGGAGGDLLQGGINFDLLYGDDGDDRLDGNNGGDTLLGGAGNDRLNGNAGNDVLGGQAGNDTLKGGLGADTFQFERGGGADVVLDFQNDVDRIALDASLFAEDMPSPEDIRNYASRNESGDVVLTFATGDVLTFSGVTATTALINDIDIFVIA